MSKRKYPKKGAILEHKDGSLYVFRYARRTGRRRGLKAYVEAYVDTILELDADYKNSTPIGKVWLDDVKVIGHIEEEGK